MQVNEGDDGVSTSGSTDEGAPIPETRPVLRIVKGDATPEEIAALVAVVASLDGGQAPAPRRTPEWSAPHRSLRRTLPHGPGGWRSSGLPG